MCLLVSEPVLEDFVELLAPFELPDPLGFLPPSPAVRRLPVDLDAAISKLAGNHRSQELVHAGLAVVHEDGGLNPSPRLGSGGDLCLVVRNARGEAMEILTSHGTLTEQALPLVAAFQDAAGQTMKKAACGRGRRRLFVCFSLEDAGVLRALDFPTTIARGLDELTPENLIQLSLALGPDWAGNWGTALESEAPVHLRDNPGVLNFDALGWSPPTMEDLPPELAGEQARKAARIPWPQVVLVGWSPSRWSSELPPSLAPLSKYLAQLGRDLGIPASDVACWSVTEEELARLRELAVYRRGSLISEALRALAKSGSRPLVPPPQQPLFEPPQNFAEARADLLDHVAPQMSVPGWLAFYQAGRSGSYPQHAIGAHVAQMQFREVVQPLIADAATTPDAVQRSRKVLLAELFTTAHNVALATAMESTRLLAGLATGPVQIPELPIGELVALCRLIGSVTKDLAEPSDEQ